jgi:hypothetical protein
MDHSNELIIREIEKNVLDEHKTTFEAFYWPNEIIIPTLLTVWGDTMRFMSKSTDAKFSSFYSRIQGKMNLMALTWCIKWTIANENKKPQPIVEEQLIEETTIFLEWGYNYHILAQNHIAWSRKAIDMHVNPRLKKITVKKPSIEKIQFDFLQEYNANEVSTQLFESQPSDAMQEYFSLKAREIYLDNKLIQFRHETIKNDFIFPIVFEWMKSILLPELEDSQNLDGYSLLDMRKIFTGLYIYSVIIVITEQYLDYKNSAFTYHSAPLIFSKHELGKFLSDISGVNAIKCYNIISDFTLGLKNFHSSITNQFFIECLDKKFYFLPRLFTHLDFCRTVAGALSKKDKKRTYDSLINTIEKHNLLLLSNMFLLNGYQYSIEQIFSTKGMKIQPDILVWDEKFNEILIIDYKHFLVPLNANETLYKIAEIKKGIAQLTHYERVFKNNDQLLISKFTRIQQGCFITKVLLFKNAVPVPFEEQNEVFCITTNQLAKMLNEKRHESLSKKIKELKDASFKELEGLNYKFEMAKRNIRVNDWTYSRYVYAVNKL